ncbi:MAG: hypothetical protein NTW08_03900 [Gammaproteobacteria bacterium]|nr:hypothetical protein [Gammaproteobacteria bacterium]
MPRRKKRPTTLTDQISVLPDWILFLSVMPGTLMEMMILRCWVGTNSGALGGVFAFGGLVLALVTTAFTILSVAKISNKHWVDEKKWNAICVDAAHQASPTLFPPHYAQSPIYQQKKLHQPKKSNNQSVKKNESIASYSA